MTGAPAPPNPEVRFDHAMRIIDALSKIVLLVGGIFAVFQYFVVTANLKVERTVAYLQRYEDGSVADARHRISSSLRAYVSQLEEAEMVGSGLDDRNKLIVSIVENDPHMPDDIERVADYFEGLAACVDERLCDGAVAERYFDKSDTEIIWKNFEPYFLHRRKNSATYASGLERFSSIANNGLN